MICKAILMFNNAFWIHSKSYSIYFSSNTIKRYNKTLWCFIKTLASILIVLMIFKYKVDVNLLKFQTLDVTAIFVRCCNMTFVSAFVYGYEWFIGPFICPSYFSAHLFYNTLFITFFSVLTIIFMLNHKMCI